MLACPALRLSVPQQNWSRWSQTCSLLKPTCLILNIDSYRRAALAHQPRRSLTQTHAPRQKRREKGGRAKTPLKQESRSQAAWLDEIEPLLPLKLRLPSVATDISPDVGKASALLTKVLVDARRKDEEIDVLAELGIKHERWSAVLFIVESLIENASKRGRSTPPDQLPSNLHWPTDKPLDSLCSGSIELQKSAVSTTLARDSIRSLHSPLDDVRTQKPAAIEQVWTSLGCIIVEAANLAKEQSGTIMGYVHQIIARLHTSGLVPDNVYTYVPTGYASTVNRPPTMQLLSSKFLITLSDAIWRADQDVDVTKTRIEGATDRQSDSLLAGRYFRSNPHQAGCGLWLEFVLWCCADGGYPAAGSRIVGKMQKQKKESQWFAARWPAASADEVSHGARVDSLKTPAHQNPPLNEEKCDPESFTEVEGRTVSVEVILALTEAAINARAPEIDVREGTQEATQSLVLNLLTFLQPHALPPGYLDYLAVRLFQPTLLDYERDGTKLQKLAAMLGSLGLLQSTPRQVLYVPSLNVESILGHSEVRAGIYHQALESLAVAGRIHPTIDMFNQIQQLVDQSKLNSIDCFMYSPGVPESDRDFHFSQEYSESHGQLPAQKLAAFLDALTNAEMTEVGQWLLYSMDVDGPLIPLSDYDQSSLIPSILRFAGLTNDPGLIDDVQAAVSRRGSKPPVSFLRSLMDCSTQLRDTTNAERALQHLSIAKGGGFHLHNLATVFATLFRIEQSSRGISEDRTHRLLAPFLDLLSKILHGRFGGKIGDFRKEQIQDHQRGLACLFRVLDAIPGSIVCEIARSWLPKLVQSDTVSLDARVFNIILSAVVQMRGAKAGMVLWDLLCEEPSTNDKQDEELAIAADTGSKSVVNGWGSRNSDSTHPGAQLSQPNPVVSTENKLPSSGMISSCQNINGASEGVQGRERRRTELPTEANKPHPDVNGLRDDANSQQINGPRLSTVPSNVSGSAEQAHMDLFTLPDEQITNTAHHSPQANNSIYSRPRSKDFTSEDLAPYSLSNEGFVFSKTPFGTTPVVRPTYQTFAIIIRTAIQEMQAAKALEYREEPDVPFNISEAPSKANMRALEQVIGDIEVIERWASPLFQRFGMDDKAVALEFQWQLGEVSRVFSKERLQEKYRAASTEYQMAKMGVLANFSELSVWKQFLGPPAERASRTV